MGVNPPALRNILRGVADRIAVFHDVLARGDVAQGELVSPGDVVPKRHADAVYLDRLALVQVVGQRDGDIIRGIDFQKSFHIDKMIPHVRLP